MSNSKGDTSTNAKCNPQQWVTLYADELYRYAYARLRNLEVAEDMVQETFLAALKSLENFKGNSSEKTWLTAILKNKLLDHWKKSSTKNEKLVEEVNNNENFYHHFFDVDSGVKHWKDTAKPAQWQNTYVDVLQQKEFFKTVEHCLSKLNEKQKAVFKLKFFADADGDEICKELNITSSNYWVMMHRAKLLMRECLEKNWFKN